MNLFLSVLSTFTVSGLLSAIVGYLAEHVNPVFAAIIWTYPFTLIVPLYVLHRNKKSNTFIGNFVRIQTFAVILIPIVLYFIYYFISRTPTSEGVVYALIKASLIWVICSILYYVIIKITHLDKHF